MSKVGSPERVTQNRVVQLFQKELGYAYLGHWQQREGNSNIEVDYLQANLARRGYSAAQIHQAIFKLQETAQLFDGDLYTTNKNVYQLLRYGIPIKTEAGGTFETVHFIDWQSVHRNDFALAEEVTLKGNKTKRPDVVLYLNGIAVGVLELKHSSGSVNDGIRQNLGNQQDRFIQPFFTTIQYCLAGSDTEGLRYGTIETPEKYYLQWKEDLHDNRRNPLDKYLLKLFDKARFIELLHDFVLFDGGIKKLPRVHQYFGVKAAQSYINRYEGGIIWHTQGSGKSLTMVWLAKWILENKPQARVVVLTDRTELDHQIENVFNDVGEPIYRTSSGRDLMRQLGQAEPRMICSLIHKFGHRDVGNFKQFIQELENAPPTTVGEFFIFIDECHRTQSGRLHRTMKAILPTAVFLGFTGTPLLKKDKKTSSDVFGTYIHTYKFNEGVEDGVILDLMYEARDIDQRLLAPSKVDAWFKAKTRGLNDFQTMKLKKKWGTMQKVLSSRHRMERVVADIIFDFGTKPRLNSEKGNAILVAGSILEACKYYELFLKTELKNKCAIITSYSPKTSDISTEDTGTDTETDKEFIYNCYENILKQVQPKPKMTLTESYEDWAKQKFKKQPATMKLLIVVSKLLTGFDAPSCTYLYIDKSMQDHGLFQAITRVNRLHGPDKLFGYIIDYKDLFKKLVNEDGTGALQVYTSELDDEHFSTEDIHIRLQERLKKGKERLDNALEALALLCEPVKPPKDRMAYIRYFCGNTELKDDLKASEPQRMALYQEIVTLIRAYANIADDLEEAGYTKTAIQSIEQELKFYLQLREDIKRASGETLDLKTYEADMRHLIDTYIQADEPEKISPFDKLSLLEIIASEGMKTALEQLSDTLTTHPEAVAETIENNVRHKIIKEHLIDPVFFDNMSSLLAAIIKQRKENALDYQAYLEQMAALINQIMAGKSEAMPETLVTVAQRALYNSLGQNEALALHLDQVVKTAKRTDWRGNLPKEREIKQAIYQALLHQQDPVEGQVAHDPPAPYNIQERVEQLFDLIKAQAEYWCQN